MTAPDAISAIAPAAISSDVRATTAIATSVGFDELLSSGLRGLETKIDQAASHVQALALGESVPPHQVMLALEDARLSLQFALQVRNRVVEAYQELMRMQL